MTGLGGFFAGDPSGLRNRITNGGTDMPAFASRLTPAQIEAVIGYVVATFR